MSFTHSRVFRINSPCKDCIKAYSFINHLSLTSNYDQFSTRVDAAKVSGNLDAPEGGFDALIQAIVCEKEIGWRRNARHLIVFSTDAEFHIAGDGRLAGVVEPNDGRCHLVNGQYNESLTYDYPSVSFLNHVARMNNINLIFAIVKSSRHTYNTYEKLQQNIENSGVGELKDEAQGSNVVDLVLDNYNVSISRLAWHVSFSFSFPCRKSSTPCV